MTCSHRRAISSNRTRDIAGRVVGCRTATDELEWTLDGSTHRGRMHAMRRAVRGGVAVAGAFAIAMALSTSVSQAAEAPSPVAITAAAIQPAAGSVVGVGYPVTVTFTAPVGN
ncbi:MAG TPA: Ig-like domain-containing protein, partial [Mycobacterium sp.]|nr:Ig-like domain-containing protein [Mycobacterium sp.]